MPQRKKRKEAFGERLAWARMSARKSQQDVVDYLAERGRVRSRQSVGAWEAGDSMPYGDDVAILAECLGVPTDFLLLGIATAPIALMESIPPGVCPALDLVREQFKTYLQIMSAEGHDSGLGPLGDLKRPRT